MWREKQANLRTPVNKLQNDQTNSSRVGEAGGTENQVREGAFAGIPIAGVCSTHHKEPHNQSNIHSHVQYDIEKYIHIQFHAHLSFDTTSNSDIHTYDVLVCMHPQRMCLRVRTTTNKKQSSVNILVDRSSTLTSTQIVLLLLGIVVALAGHLGGESAHTNCESETSHPHARKIATNIHQKRRKRGGGNIHGLERVPTKLLEGEKYEDILEVNLSSSSSSSSSNNNNNNNNHERSHAQTHKRKHVWLVLNPQTRPIAISQQQRHLASTIPESVSVSVALPFKTYTHTGGFGCMCAPM